ncbi:MAG: hypothetical protein WCB49_13120 [Gammaproteobacteria bacterium]
MRQRQLKRLARAGEPDSFITLTSNPATGKTPDERARALVRAWRLVVKRAKRKFGLKRIPYLVVIEATKAGEPHLHILARLRWLPQAWLSEQMDDLIGAPICWIERISGTRKIAGYVAKYVGKAPNKFGGCKRYWRSLDWIVDRPAWDEANKRGGSDWKIATFRLLTFARRLEQCGYAVEWKREDYVTGTTIPGIYVKPYWQQHPSL